jgi:hypothetical protein
MPVHCVGSAVDASAASESWYILGASGALCSAGAWAKEHRLVNDTVDFVYVPRKQQAEAVWPPGRACEPRNSRTSWQDATAESV